MKDTDADITAFSRYFLHGQFLTFMWNIEIYLRIQTDWRSWHKNWHLTLSTRILVTFLPSSTCYSAVPLSFKQPCGVVLTVFCFYLVDTNGQAKELPTYKDNDFINDGQKICIDDENKKMFLEKLRKDVEVSVNNLIWISARSVETESNIFVLTLSLEIHGALMQLSAASDAFNLAWQQSF